MAFLFAVQQNSSLAQSSDSYIGQRINQGLYGGAASDLEWGLNNRLFAAVDGPFTLFASDDTAKTWTPLFKADSLERMLGTRGWGHGGRRVLTNSSGWILVLTGNPQQNLTASVVSTDNGASFHTLYDPVIVEAITGQPAPVDAIDITGDYLFTAAGPFIFRDNGTQPPSAGSIITDLNNIPGFSQNSFVTWIAAAWNTQAIPYYFIAGFPGNNKKVLVRFDGNQYTTLSGFPVNQVPENIFLHPGQASGNTLFVSTRDTLDNTFSLFRSFDAGLNWTNISPSLTLPGPLSDASYSPDWIPAIPSGLRLSFDGGIVSDDLGDNWTGPASGLENYPVATHPIDAYLVLGSDLRGVAVSNNGPGGPFTDQPNLGFANLKVYDIRRVTGHMYVATGAGLAYTSEYDNPNINGPDQWISPNGFFPVPFTGSRVTAVAIDPANPYHVVCGSPQGFFVTNTGAGDFIQVTPPDWNSTFHSDPTVTDFIFLTSSVIIAVTGEMTDEGIKPPYLPAGNIWRSMDGGLTWNVVTPYAPEEFIYGNCLAAGFTGSTTVYAGSGLKNGTDGSAIWQSNDMGITWNMVNSGPSFGNQPPQPVLDVLVQQSGNNEMFIAAGNLLAYSTDGGLTYNILDTPMNDGKVTSILPDPVFTDSLYLTTERQLHKYNIFIDESDRKFKGLPGEKIFTLEHGSVLAGSNSGLWTIEEAPTHTLDLTVFLEGAFNGTEMNTDLVSSGLLPGTQPFNTDPWFYNGSERITGTPSSDIVDWVLVELRKTQGDPSTATAETAFDRQAGLLLKNGLIVDDDGITPLRFSLVLQTNKTTGDKIHGVVYAPAHVGERSSDSLEQAKGNIFKYDFSTGPDAVYGGKSAHKELAPGIWGMISGDGNHDFQVDNKDKDEVWATENGQTGYLFGDFNRDGTVDQTDLTNYWKPNAGRGVQIE
ncbi:MAG: hypothetical protein Kow00127_18920 [Bacteroidales bacterium]